MEPTHHWTFTLTEKLPDGRTGNELIMRGTTKMLKVPTDTGDGYQWQWKATSINGQTGTDPYSATASVLDLITRATAISTEL